jgi:hypothetical protein
MKIVYNDIIYDIWIPSAVNPLYLKYDGKRYWISGMTPEKIFSKKLYTELMKRVRYNAYLLKGKTYSIKSKSSDKIYNVIYSKGEYTCECLGYKYHKNCWHIDRVKSGIVKESYKTLNTKIEIPRLELENVYKPFH